MLLQFYSHFWYRGILSEVLEPRTKQLILGLTLNNTEMNKRVKYRTRVHVAASEITV